MPVYADKKNGKLTGRWRVELQKGVQRYRQRHDTHAEALADEQRVKALWAAGECPGASISTLKVSTHHTIPSVTQEAQGVLWKGMAGEETSWNHMRIISEIIGKDLPLDKIDTLVVDKLVAKLTKLGKSNSTINRYLSHLRTFLVWASRRKYLTTPIGEITFDWQKENKGRIRWITPEEERDLERLLPRNIWLFVKVGIETGCRRGELMTVEPTQIVGNRLHLWKTKTDAPRTVPMDPVIREMLQELVKTKTMPTKSKLRTAWDKAQKEMGLEHDNQFTYHITRHTCATRLVDAGVNLLVIKEFLGHKRIETTQRYAHVKPSNLEDALARRGKLYSVTPQEPQKTAA